jgi:Apea-like HEPN
LRLDNSRRAASEASSPHPTMNESYTSRESLDEALDAIRQELLTWVAPQPAMGILSALDGEVNASPMYAARLAIYQHEDAITELLVKDDRFLGNEVRMIRSLNGASGFYPNMVAAPLIRRTLKYGSSARAIQWLQEVLAIDAAQGSYVSTLWKVPVDGEVQLTKDVKLVPFDSLPDCAHKASLQNPRTGGLVSSGLDWETPSSALIVRYEVKPVVIDPGQECQSDYTRIHDEIADIILALTVVGPRPPVLAAAWHVYDDPDLNDVAIGGRYGRIMELLPAFRGEPYPLLDPQMAAEVVGQFLSLGPEYKPRVTVAIGRLQRALMRHQVGDRAVELSIALEVLLSDKGNSEMTHKVSVRGVRFLGGTNEERARNLLILKKAYEIRSKLVHQGFQESGDISIGKGLPKMRAAALVDEACQLCANLIKRVLACGGIPDWAEFDILDAAPANKQQA